jgi:hypothetical protein
VTAALLQAGTGAILESAVQRYPLVTTPLPNISAVVIKPGAWAHCLQRTAATFAVVLKASVHLGQGLFWRAMWRSGTARGPILW